MAVSQAEMEGRTLQIEGPTKVHRQGRHEAQLRAEREPASGKPSGNV